MTRVDRLALILSIAALVIVYWITVNIFEGIPHIEDEAAYIWQAQTAARGDLVLTSPPCPKCFLVPFVIDHNGLRFGKYPPGWPAVLSLGVRVNAMLWVNPILSALCVWFTYRLVKRITSEITGLLAAFLTLTSPFFLMNSGSLLSHTWSLLLTILFILAWMDLTSSEGIVPFWMPVAAAGLSLGLLALTRPLTAIAIGLPFFVHGLYKLFSARIEVRTRILWVGAIALSLGTLLFLWQTAVTGSPLTNPYTLWWPYDRIGFNPGVGVQAGGHNLGWARTNTRFSLRAGASDLFGWGRMSWILIPFGVFALRKKIFAWLTGAVAVSLVGLYMLYWIGSWVYGPRYYFEGLVAAALFSAAGFFWLLGKFTAANGSSFKRFLSRARFVVVLVIFCLAITSNFLFYLPNRPGNMHGLFGITGSHLQIFQTTQAQSLAPALVIIHRQQDWRDFTAFLNLTSPYFDTPFVFSYDRGPEMNQEVIDAFSDRSVWHYYADTPGILYTNPRMD